MERVLLKANDIAKEMGICRQLVGERFRRGKIKGQFTLHTHTYRVTTLEWLRQQGLDTTAHEEYLANLPATLDLKTARRVFNVWPSVLKSLGVVDDDGTVHVRDMLDIIERSSAAR